MISRREWKLAGFLVLTIAITTFGWRRSMGELQPATGNVPPLGPNGLGLTYTPMPPSFEFKSKPVVNGWVDSNDGKAMIEHAWELWGGLSTEVTEQVDGQPVTFPTFETWVDEFTVFPPPSPAAAEAVAAGPKPAAHRFTTPRQLRHRGQRLRLAEERASTPTPQIPRVVTVKYTKEIYNHVFKNKYNQTSVMNALNESWTKNRPATPLADRKVLDFDDKSIMLKPTYQIVSGKQPSLVTFWAGPASSSNPSAPGFTTWTTQMLVVPTGLPTAAIKGVPIVGVDQFYNFKLNKQEAEFISSLQQGQFVEGDYAILVAMHVSSREIDNWTWQTFWWSLDKPKIPEKVRPLVKAPFDHYDVAVGYSFTTGPDSPAGLNVVCFNPYLEADFDKSTFAKPGQLGIESNCMSCHRAAAWPPPNLPNNAAYFTANGILQPYDPYFQGMTKVDFIWGFADDVTPPPPSTSPGP